MYGDIRTCIKCKNKAYCAECWFKYFSGESIAEYEKRINELEQARKDKKK